MPQGYGTISIVLHTGSKRIHVIGVCQKQNLKWFNHTYCLTLTTNIKTEYNYKIGAIEGFELIKKISHSEQVVIRLISNDDW